MDPTSRERVLQEINAVFAKEGLPLWRDLKRIGKHRQGEFEITGVSHVIRDLQQYYVIVIFNVIRPNGSVGQYGVRVTPRIPTCVVAIINDQLLFVQQHRLASGRWMVELPRGWIDPERASACTLGVAQALLEREVGSEWVLGLEGFNPILIKSVWEDTGTRLDQVQIHLVQATSKSPLPKHQNHVNPRLYTWEDVHGMIDRDIINDQTTLTALFVAERFLAKHGSAQG